MATAGTLTEIRNALQDGTITVQQVADGLTRSQKVKIGLAVVNSRLPITINTVKGAITVINVVIEDGRLYIYGKGLINDPGYTDGSWRVGLHPPPLFVPDPISTDLVRDNGDGTTTSYRLDPIAAIRTALGDVVRSQV